MSMSAAACTLLGVGASAAALTITFNQSGSTVWAHASGEVGSPAGLTYNGNLFSYGVVHPEQDLVVVGVGPTTRWLVVGGFVGPSGGMWTGVGGASDAWISTLAGAVGLHGDTNELLLPEIYTFGKYVSSGSAWNHTSISALGLVPGTYTWEWNSGAESLTVVVSAIPEPASMLSTAGLLVSGLMIRRRQ
jgi:hypothetical protein